MKRFVVVGLGNFGAAVAETLHAMGHDVAALDTSPERVDEIGRRIATAGVGDGTDERTLRRIGAQDADAAVVSTGENITASALTALALRGDKRKPAGVASMCACTVMSLRRRPISTRNRARSVSS